MRRNSRQKEAIIRVLKGTHSHPTAEQIYETVKREIPHISKGTVYRNLQVLQETGEVTELSLEGEISRYEIKQKAHYHFRCERCGDVMDLDEPVDKELDKRVTERTGLKVYFHQTEFRGLCKSCQKQHSKKEEIPDDQIN